MVGLESALAVVHEAMVRTGLLDWADVARVMSTRPAEIGRLEGYAAPLAIGAPVALTLYDPTAGGTFTRDDLHGKSSNSPYLGLELPGHVVHVWHGARQTVSEGTLQ